MFISFKGMLIGVCAVALLFVAWRFILPLVAMHMAGIGVAIPLPPRFARAYPRLTAYLFVVGVPVLFFALVVALVWLVRVRFAPR